MQNASNSKAIAARATALLPDACATDSEAEDRVMYSDQESNPDRENHPPNSGKAATRAAVGASQPSSTKSTTRFKVVRYEEYRQKWGTKGRASVWDEHLPGVPTSLPPKTEMELRTEQSLLVCDPLPPSPIPYPHAQCHQQPQLSRRSHYERIPLAMLHYPKCDQARKPGAAGRLEVVAVRADDEPSPARSRRRHKASLPFVIIPNAPLDGASATGTPPAELVSSEVAAPSTASFSAANATATATTATSESSKVPSSSVATPPLLQSQQSSQPPSRQAPPPLTPLQSISTPPQPNLDLEASEDRSDEPPNPPNPPASPVPEQRSSPTELTSAEAVATVAAAATATSTASASTPRVGGTEICSVVRRGRFIVESAGGATTGATAVVYSADQSHSQIAPVESATAVSSVGEVSQNALEVATKCQNYKPALAHLFTPERVQAAFNWISHYRSEPPNSEPDEDSTFHVTIDNVAQTVVYLTSQDGKKKKEQPPVIASATLANASGTGATVGGSSVGGGGGGGSSSGSGNMTRSSSVETRLEARINGVTDMLQGAILSTVKSEMEPLQQLVQQLRTAVQQRDAEIQLLNQSLRPLLSEEAMTAILNRQARLSRPE